MQSSDGQSLEQALTKTETDAEVTLKAADAVVRSLRRFRAAARVGNFRELRSSMEAVEKGMAALRQQFANAKEGWTFDEESYFARGLYSQEIISAGKQAGVSIFERDDRLYCYPVLIRISSSDKAVFVDKKRENRIRPSVLVTRLKELQRKPPLFRPEAFLESLYRAYSKAVAMRGKELLQMAPVIPLVDIYELLTLLPGQAKEYTKQEFVRDIYLLHRSGVAITRSGAKVAFPYTGRAPSKTLTIIDQAGEVKRYYGIMFTQTSKGSQSCQ